MWVPYEKRTIKSQDTCICKSADKTQLTKVAERLHLDNRRHHPMQSEGDVCGNSTCQNEHRRRSIIICKNGDKILLTKVAERLHLDNRRLHPMQSEGDVCGNSTYTNERRGRSTIIRFKIFYTFAINLKRNFYD